MSWSLLLSSLSTNSKNTPRDAGALLVHFSYKNKYDRQQLKTNNTDIGFQRLNRCWWATCWVWWQDAIKTNQPLLFQGILVSIVSVLNSFLCCIGWTMQLWMMDVAEGWRSSTIQCTCTEDEQEYGIQKTTAHKDVQEYTEGDWVPLNVRAVTKSPNVFCFQNKSSSCHENNIQHFRLFLGLLSFIYRCSWRSTCGRGGSRKCKGSRSRRRSNKRRRRRRQRRPPWPGPASS